MVICGQLCPLGYQVSIQSMKMVLRQSEAYLLSGNVMAGGYWILMWMSLVAMPLVKEG